MKDLIILGTGRHAEEMAQIAERMNLEKPQWNILGHISPQTEEQRRDVGGYPVLGVADNIDKFTEAWFALESEWHLIARLPRERCATLIDPSCFISRTAQIGRGCVLYPHCFVGSAARLDDFVFCLSGVTINHDDVLEERVIVTSKVSMAGGVRVGRGAYLGQSCTVRQNLTIGSGCLVGMGAVVVKDIPDNCVVVGNPAKILSNRNDTHLPGAGMGEGEFNRLHDIDAQ